MFTEDEWVVEDFFHPLLEFKDCVLNSINFGKAEKENCQNGPARGSVCVLTGPNMGGKSTVLRALSMVSLYAQVGCYVPARHAALPIFDRIFLRIGACDYSSRGMSTFMVEMVDLRKILKTATAHSLILIDELGRGTSAADGLGLVLAVKEYLAKLGARTIMATHFTEVAGQDTANIKMDAEGSVLTYKLAPGVADGSFAVRVMELAGFPCETVQSAKAYLE